MAYQNILIVDDSATSRMIIRRCFEIAGFADATYYEVDDGLKAMSFLRENNVDLILSDLKMPKMDGYTLIRKLSTSEATKNIPVVVISSLGDDVTGELLFVEGVKSIIHKPLSPEKVADAMEETGEKEN